MSKFKKKKKGLPAISTASLPDIVFMLLFFFMVSTTMRETDLLIKKPVLPQATEVKKLEMKSLVSTIYVGKSKDLKKRVNNYFTGANDLKTQKLVSEIKDLNYFITNTEKEALILENNLIKKHKPKYNILLKDDKSFPYIVLTKEENPRILKSRDNKIKGDYYGPYTSMDFVSQVLHYINKNSMLRKCKTVPKKECIYFHLSQCCAPCIKDISTEEMNLYREKIKNYLNNDMKVLKKELEEKMYEYSNGMNFEMANDCKLLIEKIKAQVPPKPKHESL